jgi:hypothetical protein
LWQMEIGMQVGDLILYGESRYAHSRFWEVRSVCLGAVGQESLVELKAFNQNPGRDTEGILHETTWVPECLLRDAKLYHRINTGAVGVFEPQGFATSAGCPQPTTYRGYPSAWADGIAGARE